MKMKNFYLFSFLLVFLSLGCSSITGAPMNPSPKPTQEERNLYLENHTNTSRDSRNLIRNGLVDSGMTQEEVRASWGQPDSIKALSPEDANEEWFYWDNWKFHRKVYFKDGIVVKVD